MIWSTGFSRDHRWIEVPVFDGRGYPMHRRGVTSCPGLYFLGLPWQHTWGSGRLRGGRPRRRVPGRPHRRLAAPRRRLRRPHRRPATNAGRRPAGRLRDVAMVSDAHRHIGVLPAYPFYGGPAGATPTSPPAPPSSNSSPTSTPRAPNGRWSCRTTAYPTPPSRSRFNDLCRRGRPEPTTGSAAGLWVSPAPGGRAPHRRGAGAGRRGRRPRAQAQLPARRPRPPTRLPPRCWTASSRAARTPRPGRARAHLARRRLRHRRGRPPGRPVRRPGRRCTSCTSAAA